MSYDRTNGSLITEQGSADLYIDRIATRDTENSPNVKQGSFYRQKMVEGYRGYFDSNMLLGECFGSIVKFDANSNALNSMSFAEGTVFKDNIGYYIKTKTNAYGGVRDVRTYLPKDEFFKDLTGIIKSFVAYPTCQDQKNRANGRKFVLIYQLVNPTEAIAPVIYNGDGSIARESSDKTRGWMISMFGGMESGYFRLKNESLDDASEWVSGYKGSILPQEYVEYTYSKYGQDYSKSSFDIWYDSGWGTVIQIGIAIIVGIATAGIGTALTAGFESVVAARMTIMGIQLAGEFAIAIPEAIYLKNRGENAAATMVLVFGLIPVIDNLRALKVKIPNAEVMELIKGVRKANIKTPGDLKAWIKKLPKQTREFVEEVLQKSDVVLKASNEEILKKQMKEQLVKVIAETNAKKGLKETTQASVGKFIKNIPAGGFPMLKEIGLQVTLMATTIPIIMTTIEDDEDIKNDPQGFFNALENGAKRVIEAYKNDVDNSTKLKEKITQLENDIKNAPTIQDKQAKTKIYVDFLKDMADLGKDKKTKKSLQQAIDLIRTNVFKEMFQLAVLIKKKEYMEAKNKKIIELAKQIADFFQNELGISFYDDLINKCSDLPMTSFTQKQEACDFITWVITNKPDFTYEEEYDEETITMKLDDCVIRDKEGQPDNFVINNCGIRNAYKLYFTEYQNQKK